ncbi:unnamed protein product [Mytilus coruscus]|uniref:Uncharacterized protein n=1 Tax=Mytilus coruscus TaxID=42192 RepID=A0A6J8D045_MYTCO|nr:unnamed protein product [Mytilus coruscus]
MHAQKLFQRTLLKSDINVIWIFVERPGFILVASSRNVCFVIKLKDDTETSSVFVGFKDLRYTDQERIRKAHEKLVLASKTEKPETKKGKRIADVDESEWKPHTKKPKTATQSEKELAAEKHAYQIPDHYEESHLAPPTLWMMKSDRYAKTIYTGGEHTYKIENLSHIYISKQKDIVLLLLKYTSENKKTIVKSEFISGSQQVVVDIRDYSTPTEQSGDIQIPTDKAVTLTEEQWNLVLYLHFTVVRDLADNFGYSEDFADELSV